MGVVRYWNRLLRLPGCRKKFPVDRSRFRQIKLACVLAVMPEDIGLAGKIAQLRI